MLHCSTEIFFLNLWERRYHISDACFVRFSKKRPSCLVALQFYVLIVATMKWADNLFGFVAQYIVFFGKIFYIYYYAFHAWSLLYPWKPVMAFDNFKGTAISVIYRMTFFSWNHSSSTSCIVSNDARGNWLLARLRLESKTLKFWDIQRR